MCDFVGIRTYIRNPNSNEVRSLNRVVLPMSVDDSNRNRYADDGFVDKTKFRTPTRWTETESTVDCCSIDDRLDDDSAQEEGDEVGNDSDVPALSPSDSTGQLKGLSEHDYYEEEVETDEGPSFMRAVSGAVLRDAVSIEDSPYISTVSRDFFLGAYKRARKNVPSPEMSDGASRIINFAFERAVQEAIEKGAASVGCRKRRFKGVADPLTVSKEELKLRLERTAEELRPLMLTGMVSRNSSHGLTHSRDLWSLLKTDKKLLANLFWEAKQQATTNQPASAYARYTLVAFYAASECLTYPQAAYRCSISYTTAIEYIALCEVRHYFGEAVAKEIHEFTKQQIDAEDPNCMRAWSNNCAKFLSEHRYQRELKKNADLARPYDCRLYIHLKGDKRPFRVQKLQNCFLRQDAAAAAVAAICPSGRQLRSLVDDLGTCRSAVKRRRPIEKPRTSLVDVEPDLESSLASKRENYQDMTSASSPLGQQPPVPWSPQGDPFFLKSVTDMMKTPEDLRKASDILYALSCRDESSDDITLKMKALARIIAATERQ